MTYLQLERTLFSTVPNFTPRNSYREQCQVSVASIWSLVFEYEEAFDKPAPCHEFQFPRSVSLSYYLQAARLELKVDYGPT